MKAYKKIAIIGNGNVGSHLSAWLSCGYDVFTVSSRTLEGLPEGCDAFILTTKDDCIREVAEKISYKSPLMIHTSGSMGIEVLCGCADHTGVMYPLQTFTSGVEMKSEDTPVFIEGDSDETFYKISDIASAYTQKIYKADSELRKKLHIAAVFGCNFTNALIGIADELLHKEGLDYRVLMPLIAQTFKKLERVSPLCAQTGPAVRKDISVIDSHLKILSSQPEMQKIYGLLTKYIINSSKTITQ